ncbi:MAG: DUF736 family protein [Rhizobiales bacterium]|nr:DUF736 family protein [Hyphomicrobiales bacterium]
MADKRQNGNANQNNKIPLWNRVGIGWSDSDRLDDPSFPAPIYASLVEIEGAESLSLIWSGRTGE